MALVRKLTRVFDTLSGRLGLVYALLVLPPTIVSLFLAWGSYVEHTTRAQLQVRQFATLTATYESKFFDDVKRILQELGSEETLRVRAGPPCDALLRDTLDRTPEFASIDYFGIDGQKLCGLTDRLDHVANQSWMREARSFRGFVISDYTVTPQTLSPVIVAAQAVYGSEGHLDGVLAATIRLFWLSAFINELSLPAESVFFLIDSKGNVLADRAAMLDADLEGPRGSNGPDRRLDTLAAIVGRDVSSAVLSRRMTDFVAPGIDGVRRVFSSVALPHGNVTVLFGMPTVSAFGWLEKDLISRVLGLFAIVVAGLGAAWLGTRYLVTRWTSSLGRMARAYGRGNYTTKLEFERAPRELRDLGETLSLMAGRIEMREAELRTSLEQKDTILKEIHHRVKNNLQIVSSLLNIRGGDSGFESSALNEVRAHVTALALVHRHLYESDDIERVDLRSFMTELCQRVLAGLSRPSQRISLEIEIPEFMISTDRAIPIALFVTEAMTNSLKHAFAGRKTGRIRVQFERSSHRAGLLTVADDGAGFYPRAAQHPGLGLQLMEAFAHQIGSELVISGPPGTVVQVSVDDGADVSSEAPAEHSSRAARATGANASDAAA